MKPAKRKLTTQTTVFLTLIIGLGTSCFKNKDGANVPSKTESAEVFDDIFLGEFQGKPVTIEAIDDDLKKPIWLAYRNFERMKQNAMKDHAERIFLKSKAKTKKTTPKLIKKEYFAGQDITPEKIRKFYEDQKANIPYPFESIKNEIRRELKIRASSNSQAKLANDVNTFGSLKLPENKMLAPKVTLDTQDYPRLGDKKALIEIVEFADFTCPHCRKAAPALKKLQERHSKHVSVVFRYFPRRQEGDGLKLAQAALCSHKQSGFWRIHESLYNSSKQWLEPAKRSSVLKNNKLHMTEFSECMSSAVTRKAVLKSRSEGSSLGVTSTPTFFVNGRLTPTDHSLVKLEEAVSKLIAKRTSN